MHVGQTVFKVGDYNHYIIDGHFEKATHADWEKHTKFVCNTRNRENVGNKKHGYEHTSLRHST